MLNTVVLLNIFADTVIIFWDSLKDRKFKKIIIYSNIINVFTIKFFKVLYIPNFMNVLHF